MSAPPPSVRTARAVATSGAAPRLRLASCLMRYAQSAGTTKLNLEIRVDTKISMTETIIRKIGLASPNC